MKNISPLLILALVLLVVVQWHCYSHMLYIDRMEEIFRQPQDRWFMRATNAILTFFSIIIVMSAASKEALPEDSIASEN